jgi:hypothetical protein
MADYPSIPYSITSSDSRRDPVIVSVARSGKPKVRRLYPAPRRAFTLSHAALTDAQRATLEAFLNANRNGFTIYYPSRATGSPIGVLQEGDEVRWTRVEQYWRVEIPVIED